MKSKDVKEVQGRKSRIIGSQNRAKLFLMIAKEPLSFSELLEKTGFSKPILMKHLKTLQEEDLIYKDTVKPTQTSNPLEIGKIVYRVKEDEISNILKETIMVSFSVIEGAFDDPELNKKIRYHCEELSKIIVDYLNWLHATREKALETELERIKRRKA